MLASAHTLAHLLPPLLYSPSLRPPPAPLPPQMSIDVYNRTDDVTSKLAAAVAAPGAPGAPVAAPAAAAAAAEEDDMDALLSA